MQYQVNTDKFTDSKAEGTGGRQPGAYLYKITSAETKTPKDGGDEYISYDMVCSPKGEGEPFNIKYQAFFPNGKNTGFFDSFLITSGKTSIQDTSDLVGASGIVVLRKKESIVRGELREYLDEVVSFFTSDGLSGEEKLKGTAPVKLKKQLAFVEANPVRVLSQKDKDYHNIGEPTAPASKAAPPATAGVEDADLPF